MQDLTIGLVQTQLFWEDKTKNLRHFESSFFEKLKDKRVDLVLLPEMFNTGFSMKVAELGEEMGGETVAWMIDWAQKLDCMIGGSLIVQEGNGYFNRFVVAGKKGVEAFYDKRHLFRMAHENDHFKQGEERTILNIKGWNILLQVCYDLRFPVFSRNKVVDNKRAYDAVFYVANWPKKRSFIWKNLIQARAIENQVFSVGVNRVGQDGKGIDYSGHTMVVDPWGNVAELFEPGREMMKVVKLEKQILEDITNSFPAFLDAD